MESIESRRTYVLIRKYLREVKNTGREGWEGDKRWPRRNLGTSKTWERLLRKWKIVWCDK